VLCVAVGLPRPFPSDFRYHTVEARRRRRCLCRRAPAPGSRRTARDAPRREQQASSAATLTRACASPPHLQVHDSPEAELSSHFDACFAFISEALAAGGGVLVHCFAGRSRSVTVLLAFLMRQQHLTLQARPYCATLQTPLPPRSRAPSRARRRRWPWCMPCGPSRAPTRASCGS
jgi:hypothetical protein